MNVTELTGRLTKDPETKYTKEQLAITTFTLAVDRPSKNEKLTDFIQIKAFGKQAESCEKYLFKGSKCGVVGSIKTGSYKNKEDRTVYTTDVIATSVEFLSDKNLSTDATEKKSPIPDSFETVEEIVPF